MEANLMEKLQFLAEEVEGLSEMDCTFSIENGMAASRIVSYSEFHNTDLIVMGTTGAGRGFKKIWGSTAYAVIKAAECPVLAVPKGAIYIPKEKVIFAFDNTRPLAQALVESIGKFY